MFEFDSSYQCSDPSVIRDDFISLYTDHEISPKVLLDSLAVYLPSAKLAEFMDDLAMGRV